MESVSRSEPMNSYRALYAASLVLLVVIVGCGSGEFNPNNVTVTVSPAAISLPANGQALLQATASHGCDGCDGCEPFISWDISENNGANCTRTDTLPAEPCPGGTIQGATGYDALLVTYFAPSTPGTFHVNADDLFFSNFFGPATTTIEGTSVVTVSP
jgi:hypothetical protein